MNMLRLFLLSLITVVLALTGCASQARWKADDFPKSISPEQKLASAGVLRTQDSSLMGQSSLGAMSKVYFSEGLEALDRTVMAYSTQQRVSQSCFQFQLGISTPSGMLSHELPVVPTLSADCAQELENQSVRYLVALPRVSGYMASAFDGVKRPVFEYNLVLYDVASRKPVMNAVNSEFYFSDRKNYGEFLKDMSLSLSEAIPAENPQQRALTEQKYELLNGLEFLLGINYSAVTNGSLKDRVSSKYSLVRLEGAGYLRYISDNRWGVEYGYSKGKTYINADGGAVDFDLLVASSHRLALLYYPFIQNPLRVGFGFGMNYTSAEFDSDYTSALEKANPNVAFDWESGSGFGYLAKLQLDFMFDWYRMGMSLGYEMRSTEIMGDNVNAGHFLLECQLVGFRIKL